jgi:Nickel uptake substrate-specific transmembrane region.
MMMKHLLGFTAGAALAVLAAVPASAHRQWLLPSSTIVSGDDVWVTVDAAVSNDLFYFEHQPLRLDAVKAWAPDGSEARIENAATGRYRSTFDVHLTQRGTWRIASVSDGLVGSYELGGKTERLPRGTTLANLAMRLPAGAANVKTAESSSRNEIFVTVGEPTTSLFTPSGKGIELAPVTHPNDLFAGETAIFQFLLDGKAAAGLPVTVIPGGIRYRDQLGQIDLVTDAEGKVEVTWPEAGLYWLNVTTPRTGGDAGEAEAAAPKRRASYATTLEVMAP